MQVHTQASVESMHKVKNMWLGYTVSLLYTYHTPQQDTISGSELVDNKLFSIMVMCFLTMGH